MYEFGCFVVFWSNFELMLEVAIGLRSNRPPRDNALALVRATAGEKKAILLALLPASEHKAIAAVNQVFSVAERNSWIHGTILNPKGDFSTLTLLRVEKKQKTLLVSNAHIDTANPAFQQFYRAYEEVEKALSTSASVCNEYITALQ